MKKIVNKYYSKESISYTNGSINSKFWLTILSTEIEENSEILLDNEFTTNILNGIIIGFNYHEKIS